jgi:hypothetical protein
VDHLLEIILTNAGFAGALLIIAGWALWKKDQQVRELTAAAIEREREVGTKFEALTAEYTAKLTVAHNARTNDSQRVRVELSALQAADTKATVAQVAVLTQLTGVLAEIRQDVRPRRRSRTPSPEGEPR